MPSKYAEIKSASTDPNELLKYKKVSSFWWDPNGPLKSLHQLNEIRIPFFIDCLKDLGEMDPKFANTSKPLTNLKIMDVGCRGGFFSEALSELGATVIAIDPCAELIQVAKDHQKENKNITNDITYINTAIERICDEYINQFDAVIFYDVSHNVANVESVVKASLQVLKPGGSIFHATFNKTSVAWVYGIIFLQYVSGKVRREIYEFSKFVSPQEFINLLKKNNCETKTVKGSILHNDKWIFTKDQSYHYLLHAVKNK